MLFPGGLRKVGLCLALEPLGWTQQVQKGQMRAGAGPGKLGIPAGGSSLCSGSSSSLDRTHSTDSKHQLGADLSSKQSCPSPEPGKAGDTPGGPCCAQTCTGDKAVSPQGWVRSQPHCSMSWDTPGSNPNSILQPPSGVWGLQCQRNTCTHLSTAKHFPKIQSFHFSHSLPALHCGSLLGILGFCASFWLFHGQLCSGGWIW